MGKQGIYIIAQLCCEYVFHFGSLWILCGYVAQTPGMFVGCLGLTYISMILCGSMIVFGVDWKEESRKIRGEMAVKQERNSEAATVRSCLNIEESVVC